MFISVTILVGNFGAQNKEQGQIELGNTVYLLSKPRRTWLQNCYNNLEQGILYNNRQQLSELRCSDFVSERVTIGNDVIIAPDVIIADEEIVAVSA